MSIHAVAAHERLKSQITYGYIDVGSTAASVTNNLFMTTPGLSYGSAAAAGLAGGLIASAIINAEAYASAKRQVSDAEAEFVRAQCKLSNTDALFGAVERSVAATAWGTGKGVARHVLAPKQSADDVVPQDAPRYELLATYSMTPDYAALVTSVTLAAYSSQLPGAPARWQKKPAWVDDLVVVSDVVPLADKTPADVDAAVAREKARYEATGVYTLIAAANGGDREARRQAAALLKTHQARTREAKRPAWSLREAAAMRARVWSADDCTRVRAALAQGAGDIETMLGTLFAGALPRASADGTTAPLREGSDRVVQLRPGGQYIARGPDANVVLGWRYSWYPEDRSDEADDTE